MDFRVVGLHAWIMSKSRPFAICNNYRYTDEHRRQLNEYVTHEKGFENGAIGSLSTRNELLTGKMRSEHVDKGIF